LLLVENPSGDLLFTSVCRSPTASSRQAQWRMAGPDATREAVVAARSMAGCCTYSGHAGFDGGH
jgi:hypothetical protein